MATCTHMVYVHTEMYMYTKDIHKFRKELGREKAQGQKKGAKVRYGRSEGECTEGQDFEQSCVALGNGELGVANKKVLDTRKSNGSRIQQE